MKASGFDAISEEEKENKKRRDAETQRSGSSQRKAMLRVPTLSVKGKENEPHLFEFSSKKRGNDSSNTPEEFTVKLPSSCSAPLRLCVTFFIVSYLSHEIARSAISALVPATGPADPDGVSQVAKTRGRLH